LFPLSSQADSFHKGRCMTTPSTVVCQTINDQPLCVEALAERYWDAVVPAVVEQALTRTYGAGWRAYAAWLTRQAGSRQTLGDTILALYAGLHANTHDTEPQAPAKDTP
jgi:hypothetical protein